MKSGYIVPLDGLRAIAIVLVLVFHLDHNLLTGGFIGVDVFFVISGFIITRNILAQREEGIFSFADFYKRRFVRLFPASAVTVLLTILGTIYIYGPDTVVDVGRSGLYALLSLANIWFWLNSGYFDNVSSQNPLLHMWSLSVEEQFYLVWPALLLFLSFLPGRKVVWLGIVFLIGLVGAWWWFAVDPSGAFYMMPARTFQFASGAALAAISFQPKEMLGGISLLLGLVLIGVASIVANGEQYDFLIAAVLPTVGAVLAIFGMRNKLGEMLLGNAPMRAIGLRAYSIYLVHWPVAVFAGTLMGPNRSISANLVLFCGCLIAGDVLYRMVEKPLRLPRVAPSSGPDLSAVRIGATVLLLAGGLAISAHVWALGRPAETEHSVTLPMDHARVENTTEFLESDGAALFWDSVAKESLSAQTARFWKGRSEAQFTKAGCVLEHQAPFSDFPLDPCLSGQSPGPRFIIVGDSLSSETQVALESIIPATNIAVAGTSGCLPEYPEPGWHTRPEGCRELNKLRFDLLSDNSYDGVILTANWRWITPERFATMIAYLKEHDVPVVVMGTRPAFTESVPSILTSIVGKNAADNLDPYLSFDFRERSGEIQEILANSGADYVYIPWGEMLCPDVCRAYIPNGQLTYLDQIHLPLPVARWLGNDIDTEYGVAIRALFGLEVDE